MNQLKEKIKNFPTKIGCYLIRDKSGKILYVGKAKNLKNRVSSYFLGQQGPKVEILRSRMFDIEFIITGNEAEALILENNLIKKYFPRYNILMRDDKSYPYIEVNFEDEYPKIEYTRRPKRNQHAETFGPFVHNSHIGEVLRAIIKSFKLRDCSDYEFRLRSRPCLLYQIKQCSAPCVKWISAQEYRRDINMALDFFRGQSNPILSLLKNQMKECASQEEYEHAAILRDNIKILEDFMKSSKNQNVELHLGVKDFDVVAFYEGETEVDIAIYLVRNNLLLGNKVFHFSLLECKDDLEEEILKFILQYYSNTHDSLPKVIFTDLSSKIFQLFKKVMKMENNASIKVARPTKEVKSLVKLTREYALEHQRFRISHRESLLLGLSKLKELLGLKEKPSLIECFDIAIFQGTSPTASQVVFKDGGPLKHAYRHYHLSSRSEGNNDFAMMEEALTRRLKYDPLPDVFVVDGGISQVNVFVSILKEYKINIPIVGIVKDKSATKKEEKLIIPGRLNPYYLYKDRPLMKVMMHLRDEAHRFARRLHHKQESKRYFSSWIDSIEGIGPKTKKIILEKLDVPIAEIAHMPAKFLSRKLRIKEGLAKKIVLGAKRRLEDS